MPYGSVSPSFEHNHSSFDRQNSSTCTQSLAPPITATIATPSRDDFHQQMVLAAILPWICHFAEVRFDTCIRLCHPNIIPALDFDVRLP
jgi:hypothetical protein